MYLPDYFPRIFVFFFSLSRERERSLLLMRSDLARGKINPTSVLIQIRFYLHIISLDLSPCLHFSFFLIAGISRDSSFAIPRGYGPILKRRVGRRKTFSDRSFARATFNATFNATCHVFCLVNPLTSRRRRVR